MKVTISPDILADSEMAKYVHEATRFLEHKAAAHAEALSVDWGSTNEPGKIYCVVNDGETNFMFLADKRHMKDINRREFSILRIVSGVLANLSKQNMKLIDRAIQRISEEEFEHAHG